MPLAKLSNAEIAYVDEGQGPVVVLIHGFASNKEMNWIGPGWVKALTNAGYRVIALDNRGHGDSTKFYDDASYALSHMADDAVELMDHLGIDQANIMGYSMGARITCTTAINHPERCQKLILGGNGLGMIEGTGDWEPVRQALLAENASDVNDLRGKAFRLFAEKTKADLQALAHCVIGVRQLIAAEAMQQIDQEVLVAIGSKDDIAGSGDELAKLLPNGAYLEIPKRDHMTAVGDKVYINGVLDFLAD